MARTHTYKTTATWTGNTGTGTSSYLSYERAYDLSLAGKPTIAGSSDPAFRGDKARWNPEELLIAAISACHQLWFLHLCSTAGVAVHSYVDEAEGMMEANADGTARFTSVLLRPHVTVPVGISSRLLDQLHLNAHAKCVIAQSVQFPVSCIGTVGHDATLQAVQSGAIN